MKKYHFIPLVLLTALFYSCPSAPPPVTDGPVTQDVPGQTGPVDGQSGTLTETELAQVRQAITDAETAQADLYAPELLMASKDSFAEAQKLGSTGNPTEGRRVLAQALQSARDARTRSLAAMGEAQKSRLANAEARLKNLKGQEYYPEQTAGLDGRKLEITAKIDGDPLASKNDVDALVGDYVALAEKLEGELAQIIRIQQDVTEKLAEAEALEAYIWTPDLLEQANDAFFRGKDSHRRKNLAEALDAYTQARFLAGKALSEIRSRKAKKETEDLMLETMRRIEKASNLIIVDENDDILQPQPWNGETYIQPKEDQPVGPQSYLLPADGTTLVLEEVSRSSYLSMAKDLWFKGVEEKNKGNFPVANEFFLEAQKYVALYEALAVDKIYTVRLIPERRDALWRIAEYAEIYNDPLKWPLIWKRNRKLIQNPDLIYPGWQLIVPPQ